MATSGARGPTARSCAGPAWSPDGQLIAYTTSQDNEGQFEGRGPYMDVHVMRRLANWIDN